jgi:hypothetical protein
MRCLNGVGHLQGEVLRSRFRGTEIPEQAASARRIRRRGELFDSCGVSIVNAMAEPVTLRLVTEIRLDLR